MMEQNEAFFENIERYLNNQLEGDELLEFEAHLASDLDFKNEVEKHRVLQKVISDKDALAYKEKLITIGKELKAEEKRSFFNFSIFKIAAGFVVLIGLGSYFVLNSLQSSSTDIFQNYFSVYPVEEISRGDNLDTKVSIGNIHDSILKRKIKAYLNNNYKEAVLNLEKLRNEYPTKEVLKLYLGNSYLKINNETKAIAEFQSIDSLSTYFESAQWYLALSYLKTDKPERTKEILKKLFNYNGAYSGKASSLLKELE